MGGKSNYEQRISIDRSDKNKIEADDVQKMHFLLATVYESARLLPAGPLLQRCSLKHGMALFSLNKNCCCILGAPYICCELMAVHLNIFEKMLQPVL